MSEWQPRDKAYHDISEGIKRVVNAFLGIVEKSEPKQPAVRRRAQANHRSFAAVGYQTATPRYQKRLPPMRYGPSLGMRLQNFFINFSFREFKRRTHRGYLVVLLFLFGVFDLLVLPYLTWTLLPAIGIVTVVFVLILFAIGTCSKHNAIGGIATLAFFIIWLIVAVLYIPHYSHLAWSLPTIFLANFIISLLRLELFRKH